MTPRRIPAVLLAVILAIALSACGDKLQGHVTAKKIKPGYTFVYMMPMYSTRCGGSPSVCTSYQSGVIPIIYWVPTCYSIDVKGKVSGDTCISSTRYEKIKIGDDYVGKDVDPKDRKVKKGRG